jgi:hypothetical protein
MLALFVLLVGPPAGARGAGPSPDPPPAQKPASPRPELPPPHHSTPPAAVRPVHRNWQAAARPAARVPAAPVAEASRKRPAKATPHRQPVRRPSSSRLKGPYVFPPAGAFRAVVRRAADNEALALVGLAALLLVLGSGSLALSLRQLRTA